MWLTYRTCPCCSRRARVGQGHMDIACLRGLYHSPKRQLAERLAHMHGAIVALDLIPAIVDFGSTHVASWGLETDQDPRCHDSREFHTPPGQESSRELKPYFRPRGVFVSAPRKDPGVIQPVPKQAALGPLCRRKLSRG
ncbi:hypothetical protein F5X99DRAFT_231108 [Biscogniauxia marginata]|nr:hypothetical protein F5X99DRAFT_231108 [Biscogniauxia marginata]